MEKRRLRAYICLIILILAAAAVLGTTGDIRIENPSATAAVLPDTIGTYRGYAILYCQNEQCSYASAANRLANTNSCPECSAPLNDWSIGERKLLPSDTLLTKKFYSSFASELVLTVVTSGAERKSIHKPVDCLAAGGYVIQSRRTMPVMLSDGQKLDVMVLDLAKTVQGQTAYSAYAYWFESSSRRTPYHYERIGWMAWNSIIHRVRSRWSYVSMSVERRPGSEAYMERLSEFVADMYPKVILRESAVGTTPAVSEQL